MFITTTTHNPTNNIFRHFSKLQILFLCPTIVSFLSSLMSSMHHLKKLHPMLTSLCLCIRQNDNQNNQYQCITVQYISPCTLDTPNLPPTIFDSCYSQNRKFPTISNGSNKSSLAPTTMAKIRLFLLHFHSITVA